MQGTKGRRRATEVETSATAIEKLQRSNLTPTSIVPLAASNAMLFVGSHKTDCDCDFPLHLILIVAGVLGLVLATLQTLVSFVVKWVTEDHQITSCEKTIVVGLKILGILLSMIQVITLVTGSMFIFFSYANVSTDIKDKSETCTVGIKTGKKIFCDHSLFTFGFCLVTMIWICLVLGAITILTVFWGQWSHAEQDGHRRWLDRIKNAFSTQV